MKKEKYITARAGGFRRLFITIPAKKKDLFPIGCKVKIVPVNQPDKVVIRNMNYNGSQRQIMVPWEHSDYIHQGTIVRLYPIVKKKE